MKWSEMLTQSHYQKTHSQSTNRRFAAFDIDGTLIRWQLYHIIVDRLAKKGHLSPDAHAQLHESRMVWKRREHTEAFKAYEETLIRIYEASLPNVQPSVFDKTVQQVIAEYKDQVYTYTRDLITTLQQKRYFLVAISGSHHELVGQIAKYYGFDDFIGTKYERTDGKYSGQKFVASHNKKQVLQEMITKHTLDTRESYAIGDSSSDAAMLEIVENPIAFNPDRNLCQKAMQQGWNIVVERKNVIYQLEYKDGNYLLAQAN